MIRFKERKPLRRQGGFIFQLSIMGAIVFLGIFTAGYMAVKQDEFQNRMDALQGNRISTVLHAIKNASATTNALNDWNVAGAPFADGTTHTGTLWLKPNSCGGPHSQEYLFCEFENEPRLGDNMQYETTISNDGTTIDIQLVVSNTAGTRGFDFNGNNGVTRSCNIARIAGGGNANLNSGEAISQVGCDTETGIITFDINWNATSADFIARNGSNSPTNEIDWGGQNLSNVNRLEVSDILDREDPVFKLDLDGDSKLHNLETTSIDTISINADTGDITTLTGTTSTFTNDNSTNHTATNSTIGNATITTAINQMDSTQYNNFAGAVAVGTGSNMVVADSGSVYVNGALVDMDDPSMFFDPNGVSRTQDIRLTARGGVALSNLLPNYVHKGSVYITNQTGNKTSASAYTLVPKSNCGDGAGYAANRLVITWQTSSNYHSAQGNIKADQSLRYVDVISNATDYAVGLRTYLPSVDDFAPNPQMSALATLYCFYP